MFSKKIKRKHRPFQIFKMNYPDDLRVVITLVMKVVKALISDYTYFDKLGQAFMLSRFSTLEIASKSKIIFFS